MNQPVGETATVTTTETETATATGTATGRSDDAAGRALGELVAQLRRTVVELQAAGERADQSDFRESSPPFHRPAARGTARGRRRRPRS